MVAYLAWRRVFLKSFVGWCVDVEGGGGGFGSGLTKP